MSALAVMCQPAYAKNEDETGNGLEEIVVTAQHREELLRDVPIAVNAVSASALQNIGVADTSALVQAVPSLNFTRSGPSGIFVIRGVATPNGSAGEEGSTAVYVDDVYMPDLASTINTFNNIQRIEVLNGPQGTLFGRNAAGGLIRVITREPGDEVQLNAQAGVGNYDIFTGQLYASAPLAENVAMDVAFTGQSQGEGFGFNPTLNKRVRTQDYWGLRSKLVAKPTDNLKITLSGDYYQTDDSTATFLWPLSYTPSTGVLTGKPASQDSLSEYPNLTQIRVWGISGKAEFDLGGATLTSISAYRSLKNLSNFDVEGLPADLYHIYYPARNRTFQQELRLSSNSTDPLSWQVGAFYLHMKTNVDQLQGGSLLRGTQSHVVAQGITDSISVFGEATYALTPSTHLTGGVRWTSDRRELPVGFVEVSLASTGAVLSRSSNALKEVTYRNVTYRAALRQDLTEDLNLYASVNKGFKSGQFNLQAPNLPPVRPQTIMAYEVGLKGDVLDRHLRFNLAAFHYDISDYQVRSTYPNPSGVGVITGLYNAAKVKIDGVDANAEIVVSKALHLTAGASWLNSRFANFGGPGTGITAPGFYPASDPGNASGNRTPIAPRLTLNLTGTYTVPFENGSELRFTGGVSRRSRIFFEPDNVLTQPAYAVFNGSVEFKANDHYSVEFYMRNIGDKLYNVQMATVSPGYAIAGAPRQYGLNFRMSY
ncbi:TonB-dependent receptor [Novosphingobium sp. JCM 18896]|uniref:TonB-dependent receptor n=1 Tax=Novosphingobium sp. JCM 18896 TaxID=2989731 RepID=UPI0022237CCA|nr:TonB-dependent receptor [Novosphingobium sp. JCM 18896]MCW1431628.1 TonB-dependent receptor [Novosphingobium sp. JCM 18896]